MKLAALGEDLAADILMAVVAADRGALAEVPAADHGVPAEVPAAGRGAPAEVPVAGRGVVAADDVAASSLEFTCAKWPAEQLATTVAVADRQVAPPAVLLAARPPCQVLRVALVDTRRTPHRHTQPRHTRPRLTQAIHIRNR